MEIVIILLIGLINLLWFKQISKQNKELIKQLRQNEIQSIINLWIVTKKLCDMEDGLYKDNNKLLKGIVNMEIWLEEKIEEVNRKLNEFNNEYMKDIVVNIPIQYQNIQRLLYKRKEERWSINEMKERIDSIDLSLADIIMILTNNRNRNDSKIK